MKILLVFLAYFTNFDLVVSVHKCCHFGQELSFSYHDGNSSNNGFPPILPDKVNGENLTCVASKKSTLSGYFKNDINVGYPQCGSYYFVDVYQKSNVVCVDRVSHLNSIQGLACIDEKFNTASVPSTANFRKCCPPDRKYDAEKQFCFNPLSANDSRNLVNTLKLVGYREKLVHVEYGTPPCKSSDVVLDTIVSYNEVEINKNDALVLMKPRHEILSMDEFCVDMVDDMFERLVIRSCRDRSIQCKDSVCLRKCCPHGTEQGRRSCKPSTRPLDLTFFNSNSSNLKNKIPVSGITPAWLYQDLDCPRGKFPLDNDESDAHYLYSDGKLVLETKNKILNMDKFCMDNIPNETITRAWICFAPSKKEEPPTNDAFPGFITVFEILSAVFLLLTFFVYATLPSLSNQHGRLIMCYLITSMFSYVVMVVQSMLPKFIKLQMWPITCRSTGYLMLFTLLSSFSWLNIISFDIWSTFRAVKSSFLKKSSSGKRFTYCCLYGWGFSAMWTMFTFFCQMRPLDGEHSIFIPDIGTTSCWFSIYGRSSIPFFIIPVSFMITFNLILFVVTVKYCSSIKSELQKRHHHHDNYSLKKYTADMNEFMINIKLFILMGLTWSMEFISQVVQPQNRSLFIVSDSLNALEGVLIFCLFVLKKKVLKDLKNTLWRNDTIRHGLERATGFTTSTSSSVVQNIIVNHRKSNS